MKNYLPEFTVSRTFNSASQTLISAAPPWLSIPLGYRLCRARSAYSFDDHSQVLTTRFAKEVAEKSAERWSPNKSLTISRFDWNTKQKWSIRSKMVLRNIKNIKLTSEMSDRASYEICSYVLSTCGLREPCPASCQVNCHYWPFICLIIIIIVTEGFK